MCYVNYNICVIIKGVGMKWLINFYDSKVMQSILEWPPSIKAKFLWIAELIEEFGPSEIGMPHIKSLSKGLFEIRAKGKEGIGQYSE